LGMCVPCPCFPLINHYFYKNISFWYIIPNIYLGLGFQFGQQDLGSVGVVCSIEESSRP
jgi:hypothetical protein